MMNKTILTIIYVISSSFFGVLMVSIIKFVQDELNLFTTSFLRFFFGLILLLPYLFYKNFEAFKTNQKKLHLAASLLNIPAMYLTFSAIYLIKFEKFTAINFFAPIFISLMAIIFLKEKIFYYRIFSLFLGFIGILIVIRPGFIELELGVIQSLSACFFWSIITILRKYIIKYDSPLTVITYMYLYMTIVTFIISIFFWENPTLYQVFLLFICALFGTIHHLLINNAYKISDLSFIMPFNYISLILSSLVGFFVFFEVPDIFTWIGGLVIIISLYLISYFEKINKKKLD